MSADMKKYNKWLQQYKTNNNLKQGDINAN